MEEFFRHMPPNSGMAFVVVSHQHAGHVRVLPGLLAMCMAMPVAEATVWLTVEPDHDCLSPGRCDLAIRHGEPLDLDSTAALIKLAIAEGLARGGIQFPLALTRTRFLLLRI